MCGEISSEGTSRLGLSLVATRIPHLTRTRGRYAWAGESMIPNKGRMLISIPVLGWDKGILY